MHGMDLGYGNRVVAIKAWVALFATRDWAIKTERNQLETPAVTLINVLVHYEENELTHTLLLQA
jgi:hypothetical protein